MAGTGVLDDGTNDKFESDAASLIRGFCSFVESSWSPASSISAQLAELLLFISKAVRSASTAGWLLVCRCCSVVFKISLADACNDVVSTSVFVGSLIVAPFSVSRDCPCTDAIISYRV